MLRFSFTMDVSGAQKRLAEAISLKTIAKAASLRQEELKRVYQDATPVNPDSRDRFRGRMKASWITKMIVNQSTSTVAVTVDNTDPRRELLDVLRFGSKAHIIRARRKKFLRFPVPVNSQNFRRAVFVRHPGTRPVPALGAPLESKVQGILRAMQQDIAAMLTANANKEGKL